MFCADYIAAYIFHGLLTVGSAQAAASLTASASVDSTNGGNRANRHENELVDPKTFDWLLRLAVSALGLQDNTVTHIGGFPPTVTPLLVGVGSGVGASLTLYPFDFVRGGVLTGSSLRQRYLTLGLAKCYIRYIQLNRHFSLSLSLTDLSAPARLSHMPVFCLELTLVCVTLGLPPLPTLGWG